MDAKKNKGKNMEARLLDDKHLIGVEIEMEDIRSAPVLPLWEYKVDNSLRNGIEYTFSGPLSGKDAETALNSVYEKCLKHGNCDLSPRTGTHVHLDASRMKVSIIRNMCVLYSLLEEPIFAWIGERREANNFCLPWFVAGGDLGAISSLINSTNPRYGASKVGRYSALNLNALSKFGSLEFRHLKTTYNKNRLYQWINLILAIKQAAAKFEQDSAELVQLFKEEGKRGILDLVYTNETVDYLPNLPDVEVVQGLVTALDLLPTKPDFSLFKFIGKGINPNWEKFKAAS